VIVVAMRVEGGGDKKKCTLHKKNGRYLFLNKVRISTSSVNG